MYILRYMLHEADCVGCLGVQCLLAARKYVYKCGDSTMLCCCVDVSYCTSLLPLLQIGWLQYSPAINIVRADVIKTRSRQTSLSEESDDERIGTTGRRPSRQSKREGEGEGEGDTGELWCCYDLYTVGSGTYNMLPPPSYGVALGYSVLLSVNGRIASCS